MKAIDNHEHNSVTVANKPVTHGWVCIYMYPVIWVSENTSVTLNMVSLQGKYGSGTHIHKLQYPRNAPTDFHPDDQEWRPKDGDKTGADKIHESKDWTVSCLSDRNIIHICTHWFIYTWKAIWLAYPIPTKTDNSADDSIQLKNTILWMCLVIKELVWISF